MTGGFPLLGSMANPSSSGATQNSCTTSASANTKGAWTQIIASTANDAAGIVVSTECFLSGANIVAALDVGIGAAGSEIPILNNLTSFRQAFGGTTFTHPIIFLPIPIPAATRISIRGQATSGSSQVRGNVSLLDGGFTSGVAASVVDSVGFNSGSTIGTSVTPGLGSKGAYAQLIASTTYDYSGFFICLDNLNSNNQPQYNPVFDIAVGAAGSEKIILPDIIFLFSPIDATNVFIGQTVSPLIMCPIPAGSRIAARAQIDTAAQPIGVTLYGLRQ